MRPGRVASGGSAEVAGLFRRRRVAWPVTDRRTAYPAPVLEDVRAEAREAETRLEDALARLEKHTLEDEQRADWENVPALAVDDGRETTSDAQLRDALNDARDRLAEAEALVDAMLDGDADVENA